VRRAISDEQVIEEEKRVTIEKRRKTQIIKTQRNNGKDENKDEDENK
jgi:hypothetical protein